MMTGTFLVIRGKRLWQWNGSNCIDRGDEGVGGRLVWCRMTSGLIRAINCAMEWGAGG